jgi:hypothetical protein
MQSGASTSDAPAPANRGAAVLADPYTVGSKWVNRYLRGDGTRREVIIIERIDPNTVEAEDVNTGQRFKLILRSFKVAYMRAVAKGPEAEAPGDRKEEEQTAEIVRLRRALWGAREGSARVTTIQWLVTPDLAFALLGRNAGNRAPSMAVVGQYARDLQRGQWPISHQGLAVGPELELGDGAHRCHAIVRSGVTATMLVTCYHIRRDWENARRTWDAGRKRTKGNILELTGLVPKGQGAATAAVLRAVASLDGRYMLQPTNDEFVSMFSQLQPGLAATASLTPREFLATTRAAFVIAHRSAPKPVEACIGLVAGKVGVQAGSPAHALLLRVPDLQTRKGPKARANLMRDVLALLHLHINGEPASGLARARAVAGKTFLGEHLREEDAR